MKNLKPVAGILLVFILGALAGALAARFYSAIESEHPPHHRRSLEERVEFIMKRLTDDLDLSSMQQKDIRPIVAATEEKVRSIRDEYGPKIRALHDASIKEIKTRLAPGQQAELDRIHTEWKRRWQDRKSR
jgi:hypothetical protein